MSLVLLILTVGFWVSVAATEGWKWRMSSKKEDNNLLINYDKYHIWRMATTASWICSVCLGFMMNFDFSLLISFFLANVVGWAVYERTISFVQHDDLMYKRGDFHILKWDIKRLPVMVEWSAGAASLVLFLWML